ncbi:MAG TPA: alpha/beta hydrolase [Candidatus Acidoferrales bacterium]|nr:alpha/beta hydrolase [Candidatus Acidoferrales bacterium]
MTRFLDVRLNPVGGTLATSVALNQGTSINDYRGMDINQLVSDVRGQHVLIGTHGYNVNRADGIAHLSNWEGLLKLAPLPSIFVGVLWPGDSVWAHGLDYPEEPKIANEAGVLIAPFLDTYFGNAASISFASHSLGARLVLETISKMSLPVRRLTLMAGAIDDNCLITEFKTAAGRIEKISVLASKKDEVLSTLFPLGNLIGGIIAEGHPWWHAAMGHCGPSKPRPGNFQSPFEIPANWDYGHHNYLQIDPLPLVSISLPTDVPGDGSPEPAAGVAGWQEAWSAGFCSTRFQ